MGTEMKKKTFGTPPFGFQVLMEPSVIRLVLRRGEEQECLWQLSQEMSDALSTKFPPDLYVEMTKASYEIRGAANKKDALFLTNRVGRFWMDAQGMRNRNKLTTEKDENGIPYDSFEGIRVTVEDDLT